MKVIGKMIKQMGLENTIDTKIKQHMKETGWMINSRDKAKKLGWMVPLMKENIMMAKSKEEECLNGEMEICI